MRETSELALELECDNVICAGDLWHEKYGVNPEVMVMLYRELAWAKQKGVPWILLRGNHEIASKLNPHQTLLEVFSSVATVVNEPKILKGDDHELYMLPWYLAERYIDLAKKMAAQAFVSSCKHKILISHIGLNEAQISPSNYYRVAQRVHLNHLKASAYNLVLLGDYHMHQVLSPRVMYGGAPIQFAFGDAPDQGLWLLDTSGERTEVRNVPLRKRYPYYHTISLEVGATSLPDLDPRDNYRIQCHINDAGCLEGIAPDGVLFDPYGTRELDDTERRLAHVEGDDPIDLFRAALAYKRVQKMEYYQMGEHFLKRAMTELFGKSKNVSFNR